MDDELSSIESSMSPIIHPTSFVSTSSLFSLKKIWTSPFPSHTFETISRSAEITFFLLVVREETRKKGMAKEERGEIDVLPSYLLFYGDRTMLLDHIRRNEISRDRKGVTVALTQFQRNFEQGIYIYRKYRNLVSPIFSSRRGWKISFSRRMKTRIQRGEEKK